MLCQAQKGKGKGAMVSSVQVTAVSISFCQHLGDSLSAIWSTSNATGVQVSLCPGLQGSSVQQLSLLTSALPCTPATFAWFARVHAHSLSRVLLCDPKVYSPPGSSVHGDSPDENTGYVAMSSSNGSHQCRD